jgi:hypothetical protein
MDGSSRFHLRIAPFRGVRRGTQNTPPIHGEHYKKYTSWSGAVSQLKTNLAFRNSVNDESQGI